MNNKTSSNQPKFPSQSFTVRQGRYGAKDAFIDMRDTIQRNWIISEYLCSEDQLAIDSDWTDYWWSASCRVCHHPMVLERREIRRAKQRRCPICLAKERSDKKQAALIEKQRIKPRKKRTGKPPVHDRELIKRMTGEGATVTAIAQKLQASTATIVNAQQKMNLKSPRVSREFFKTGRPRKYETAEEARAANIAYSRAWYRLSKGLPADAKLNRGRPRKYATAEEAKAARRGQANAAYRAKVGRG